ncbi:MAG: PaaI family thioesterase [Oscillospiraceae bacterium]
MGNIDLAEARGFIEHNPIGYLAQAHIQADIVEEGHVRCVLPAEKQHMNHVGIMYAGSYFVFAESVGGVLIMCTYGKDYVGIIKNVSIDYIKPTKKDLIIDACITAEDTAAKMAYIKEHGRGQYPLEIKITDADGVHVATANITYYLLRADMAKF